MVDSRLSVRFSIYEVVGPRSYAFGGVARDVDLAFRNTLEWSRLLPAEVAPARRQPTAPIVSGVTRITDEALVVGRTRISLEIGGLCRDPLLDEFFESREGNRHVYPVWVPH